jgi:uncharacterized repeat protein (TIGR03803 family)
VFETVTILAKLLNGIKHPRRFLVKEVLNLNRRQISLASGCLFSNLLNIFNAAARSMRTVTDKFKRRLGIFALFCVHFATIAQSNQTQVLSDHVPAAVAHLKPAGRLEATRELKLAIGMPLRNKEGLTNLLGRIYNPASRDFHHYLTPAQFAETFGPTDEDYRAVTAFAKANGLKVTRTHSNRTLLDVTGSVSNIEKTFHVTLRTYRHPREDRLFYAPDVEPSLDLSAPVLHISGLDNYVKPHPMSLRRTVQSSASGTVSATGSGPGGAFMGADFRAAYVPGVALNGAGQTVGLVEFDGYYAGDISNYAALAGVPSVPLTNVYLDEFNGTPGQDNLEVALDIDMAVCMAPGLSSIIVYEGEVPDDILNVMATDALANQLSASWTYPINAETDQIFQQFAAQGQSFFNAAGDGDAGVGAIATPCDNPNITSVGGTTLTTSGPAGAWVSETVWNWDVEFGPNFNGQGSGGGVSTIYAIPSWQLGVSMASNEGSTGFRNFPDVALTADNVFIFAGNGEEENVGGTSCAAPLWAAFVALANQQAAAAGRPTLGFINPALYAIGQSVNYTNGFHDIAAGNNTWSESPTLYYAVPGYDLCSGWGTPTGSNLVNLLALDSLQISPPGGWASGGIVGGPLTPASQSYTLTNIGDAPLNWAAATTAPWLSVSLIGGALTPGGAAATGVVSLNAAASNLTVGTYGATVWFTNLTDGAIQTRAFSLAIIKPPVILTQPASLTVIGGTTATFTVGAAGGLPLNCQWQYNGLNLTTGGRVSISQSALNDTANIYASIVSTLTISNVTAADGGSYALAASNAAGLVVSSNAILTVVPSGPVIIQQPASQTVLVGATAQFAVAADGTAPFTYQWQDNGTNLTDGGAIAGSLTPTLTINDACATNIGTYTIVISNALGTTTTTGAVLSVQVVGPGGQLASADGPPIVATQPANQLSVQGGAATFSVLSSGEFPLLYQWQFDGANLDDATNATLVLTNLTSSQAGSYVVVVSNSLGSAISSNALLSVLTGVQELITFDDLPYRLQPVPAGYNNLAWSNFYYLNGVVSQMSGYSAGMVSIPKVAYNDSGAPAAISASSPFALFSAYLTAAWNDDLQVEARGYIGAALIYDNTYTLSATAPTLITFNYLGVTSVQFTSSGGFPHRGYSGAGSEFVMDNVSAYVAPIPTAPPPTSMTVLYSFGGFDGGMPSSALVQGADGNFYGTTQYGGTNGDGTVFRMTTNGTLTTLFSFDAFNAYPYGSLVQGADGNFYGTTQYGGTNDDGTVFSITTNGAFSTLASFDSVVTGGNPTAALVQGTDGNFYGTTPDGGIYGGGTVFNMTTNGTLNTLVSFNTTNGVTPRAALIQGADGNFYGTTLLGGTYDTGTVFSMTTNGTLTTLVSLDGFNAYPYGALAQGADGNLYGTTEYGGTYDYGTVFRMTTNGTLSTLTSFNYFVTGGYPTATLVQGADGNFYGATSSGGSFGTTYYDGTYGGGAIFNITTNGALNVLLPFENTNGLFPQAGLIQGIDGFFYGTAPFGGVGFNGYYNSGDGVVFRLGPTQTATLPSIVAQPANQIVPVSGAPFFSVNAVGAAPLSYSWQLNGSPIAGATQSGYLATNVQLTDSGDQFSCVISNAYGSAISSNAALIILNASGDLFFFNGPDGGYPCAALIQGADGNFYGTTQYGGTYGNGTVFRITTNGTFSTLASLNYYVTGANPIAALAKGADGNFYGTTTYGGIHDGGTVIRITPNGTLTALVAFKGSDGAEPCGALVQGANGNFYGTTYSGGTYDFGTVFSLTTNGTLTTLFSFDYSNGAYPQSALAQGTDGNFYGTASVGGTNRYGTIFKMTTNGTVTTLFSFGNSNGAYPQGALVQSADGDFYGTTTYGGPNNYGTVFSMTTNGAVTSLNWFANSNGSYPQAGLMQGADGSFYGTTVEGGTYGDGTVFSMTTNGALTTLFSFQGANGSYPSAPVMQGNDGNFYGTAAYGGLGFDGLSWSGNGAVFRLVASFPPVAPLIVTQPANQTVPVGGTATFSVTATSPTPPTYLWQRNGTNIAGATLSSYTTNGVQLSDSGSLFSCLVSNAYGSIATSNATLTVVTVVTNPVPPPPVPLPMPMAVLYSFDGFDGGHPTSALTQGVDGNLYGTTQYGAAYQYGAVFKLTTNGTLSTSVSFDNSNGAYPQSGLLQGADGNFYGTTSEGGTNDYGTVFRVATNGTLTALLSFDNFNGSYPYGALAQGADGTFYGTTTQGGLYDYGTVFSMTTNGALTTLVSFNNINGAYPYGGLVQGADGTFYGTTEFGGTNDFGTVFSMTTNGTLTTLVSFNYDVTGGYPSASLALGADDNFYGTTEYGGTNGDGTAFSITTNGTLTTLVSFDNINGAEPYGTLVLASNGFFYGTTQYGGANDNGTVFGMTTNGIVASLFSFQGTNGLHPQAGLVQGADGFFYGTATYGGAAFNGYYNSGDGVVFRLGAAPTSTPPAIVAQPVSQIAPVGGAPFFSVNAAGAAPLSYSWRLNGSPIAGATQSGYIATNVQLTDSGDQFSCLISNAYGSAVSFNAALTLFSASGPLFSFDGRDGGYPSAALIQGADGNFYGTTQYGGSHDDGTVFKTTTNGLLSILMSFSLTNGAQPSAALVQGADGNFYGTTQAGGAYQNGTVFRMTTNGTLTTLLSFNGPDGAQPSAPLVQGADGNFYGTTQDGGTNDFGTVFKITTNGALTTLFSFNGPNGAGPYGALVQGTDGNFYGTTQDGGTNGDGTVFSMTTNGALTTLFSFDGSNGAYPQAGVVQGTDGSFYGTTQDGGTNDYGTVFRMATNGTVSTLFSFNGSNGFYPSAALIQASDGNFYGTTTQGGAFGDGTVFSMSTNGTVTTLFSFDGANGSYPSAPVIQASDGNFYGTATYGGHGYDGLYSSGNGVVFRLVGSFPPVAPLIVTQPANQTVHDGGTATFSVTAASSTPLSYLWQRNGANIAGATLSIYTTNDVQLSDSGSLFSCLVGNAYGSITSSSATLTVGLPSVLLNGGFELGTFADWTTSGNFENCFVTSVPAFVHSGAYGAELGPIGTPGYISQTVPTMTGELYRISFWLNSDGQTPNEFSVSWNGATLLDQQNLGDTSWANFQLTASATTTNTVLTFGFRDDPSYFGLDDIAVYPIGLAPPSFQSATLAGGMIQFSWGAATGQNFQVQYTTDLNQANWTTWGGTIAATNSTMTVSEPIGASLQQYYRLVLLP